MQLSDLMSFPSVFVDFKVVASVDSEMLANNRLTQQKEWVSLNVVVINKHSHMWELLVFRTQRCRVDVGQVGLVWVVFLLVWV